MAATRIVLTNGSNTRTQTHTDTHTHTHTHSDTHFHLHFKLAVTVALCFDPEGVRKASALALCGILFGSPALQGSGAPLEAKRSSKRGPRGTHERTLAPRLLIRQIGPLGPWGRPAPDVHPAKREESTSGSDAMPEASLRERTFVVRHVSYHP